MPIHIVCSQCGQRFSVPNEYAGRRGRCKNCGEIVQIPSIAAINPDKPRVEDICDDLDVTNNKPPARETLPAPPGVILVLTSLLLISVIWGAGITWLYYLSGKKLDETQRFIDLMEHRSRSAEQRAEVAAADLARRPDDRTLAELRKQVEDAARLKKQAEDIMSQAQVMILREEEKLYTIFPKLKKLTPGKNDVSLEYLDSFTLSADTVTVRMTNKSGHPIKPNLNIDFIDKYGLVTEHISVYWAFTEIAPGETRIDEVSTRYYSFGSPVYYTLKFD